MSIPHSKWKEVTKDEFHVSIGRQDVHPYPVGRWPYTSEWRLRDGRVIGLTVDYLPDGEALTKCRYMLPAGDLT